MIVAAGSPTYQLRRVCMFAGTPVVSPVLSISNRLALPIKRRPATQFSAPLIAMSHLRPQSGTCTAACSAYAGTARFTFLHCEAPTASWRNGSSDKLTEPSSPSFRRDLPLQFTAASLSSAGNRSELAERACIDRFPRRDRPVDRAVSADTLLGGPYVDGRGSDPSRPEIRPTEASRHGQACFTSFRPRRAARRLCFDAAPRSYCISNAPTAARYWFPSFRGVLSASLLLSKMSVRTLALSLALLSAWAHDVAALAADATPASYGRYPCTQYDDEGMPIPGTPHPLPFSLLRPKRSRPIPSL